MNRKFSTLALCCVPLVSFAQDVIKEEKSPFKASAELGALVKTGDTKSTDLKAGLDLNYEKDLWKSVLRFDLLVKKTEVADADGNNNFQTSDQKWTIVSQTNYTLDPVRSNYVYGNLSYEDNRFSSFDSQSSVSAGWGRRWYETEKASLDADIGPGFKSDIIKATPTQESETKDSLIIQAQVLYKRSINEHVEFKQLIVAKFAPDSDDNSTYKAETSITTKLIESLAMKFSIVLDYNTEVEEGKENLNTQTAITLVYSF